MDDDLPAGYAPNNNDNDILAKTYDFIYIDERVSDGELPTAYLPLNGISMLSRVQVTGHDENASPTDEKLPPLDFTYSNFTPANRGFYPLEGRDLPSWSLSHPQLELADLDGNGLPDLVEMNGNYIRYWSNNGDGSFAPPRFMKDMPAGISLDDPNVQFMDTNGDGRIDLMVNAPGLSGYYTLNYNDRFSQRSFKPYKAAPSFSFADPEVRLMDLDGDGATDVLRNGESFECYYQDGMDGWGKMTQTKKQSLDDFPNVSFADPRVRMADMSGDGLQDIAIVHNGHIEYWPNKGYGRWGKRVSMKGSPKLPYGFNPARLMLSDVDGDGAADIIYVDNNKITLWVNKSGNGWSDPVEIKGTPPVTDMDAVRLVDINGTGTSGLLWSYDAGTVTGHRFLYLDLNGGAKPYLLNEMDNNMGAITKVEYQSSIKYYLEDRKVKNTRWKTTLPFPTLVVSRVEVIDAISEGKLTTEYSYHHGYWDGVEREFRGFGCVEQKDTEDFKRYNEEGLAGDEAFEKVENKVNFSQPMLSKSWFCLGPVGSEPSEWEEVSFEDEYWEGDPQVLSRPKDMIDLLKSLPRRARRDAYRTLRGTALRSEVYALDGTNLQGRPYTVSESLFGVREEYNPNTDFMNKLGGEQASPYLGQQNGAGSGYIFFSYSLAQRSTQWERGGDPLSQFSFTDDYDSYGQPLKQLAMAVPRGKDPLTGKLLSGYPAAKAHSGGYLATASDTTLINKDTGTQYMCGRVAQARSYEVGNTGNISVFALKEAALKKLDGQETFVPIALSTLGHSVNYYDGDAFEGESYGEIGSYGALTRSEALVITPDIVDDAYDTTPECFAATPDWSTYPTEFRGLLPVETTEVKLYDFTDDINGWTAYNQTATHTSDGRLKAEGTGAWADVHCFQNVENGKTYRISMDVDLGNIPRVKIYVKDTASGSVLFVNGLRTQGRFMLEFTAIGNNITLLVQRPASGGPNYYYYLDNVKIEGITATEESRLGYQKQDGAASPYLEGFYTIAERRMYDFQDTSSPQPATRGMVLEMMDPLDSTASVEYDSYDLLPVKVTDPGGLESLAEYDYRVMQPGLATGPNGNRTAFAFTPLGLMHKTAVMGKAGESKGDTLEHPSVELSYDFFSYIDNKGPVWVKTTQREVHYHDEPSPAGNKTIEAKEYSDGFGRVVQTRTQAEDTIFGDQTFGSSGLPADQSAQNQDAVGIERQESDPMNVVVSGWQVYDNKGRVVEKYEPFFDSGWDFKAPTENQKGEKARMFYDPRGQVVRTENPDGTMMLVVLGIPDKLNSPPIGKTITAYSPTPWESYTYDPNDLGGITDPTASAAYSNHWGTPTSAEMDALGRQVKTTQRLSSSTDDDIVMQYSFDIQGNLLQVTDAYDRTVFEHIYDLANQNLYTDHIDSGVKRALYDCMGKPVELTDAKGAQVLNSYDCLNRPVRIWAKDRTGETVTLRQKLVYGDTAGIGDFETDNLGGKPYLHYDEAGLNTFVEYDFKGNILEKTVQTIADSELKAVFDGPPVDWDVSCYRVDWESSTALDAARQTNMEYDALNRVTGLTYPEDINSSRKVLTPAYNNAGSLESVNFDGTDYVRHIAYNARGQRLLMALGSSASPDNIFVMTRYTYDTRTFRLERMKSEKYTYSQSGNEHTYAYNSGTTRQDNAFEYDLNGNILKIKNRAPDCGLTGSPDSLDRLFSYDPINRLLSATGRESDNQSSNLQWSDPPQGSYDPTACQAYTRNYGYDKMGNIQSLVQTGTNGFTRAFDYGSSQNLLNSINNGGTPPSTLASFSYDANGNMVLSNTTRNYEWDHSNQLRAYYNQAGTSEPTVYAQYLYNAGGERVKKLVRTSGGAFESVTYIDGIFEYHKKENGSTEEKNYSHIMDNSSRICMLRTGSFTGDPADSIFYVLEDHLGSSTVRLDTNGSVIDREEYYPFGDSSLRTWGKKRYRFCGKEKDNESGLYYYGMRYYAAWTCRFISVDPLAGKYPFYTPYQYAGNKPINFIDLDGAEEATNPQMKQEAITTAIDNTRVTEVGRYNTKYTLTYPEAIISSSKTQNISISPEILNQFLEFSNSYGNGFSQKDYNINLNARLIAREYDRKVKMEEVSKTIEKNLYIHFLYNAMELYFLQVDKYVILDDLNGKLYSKKDFIKDGNIYTSKSGSAKNKKIVVDHGDFKRINKTIKYGGYIIEAILISKDIYAVQTAQTPEEKSEAITNLVLNGIFTIISDIPFKNLTPIGMALQLGKAAYESEDYKRLRVYEFENRLEEAQGNLRDEREAEKNLYESKKRLGVTEELQKTTISEKKF